MSVIDWTVGLLVYSLSTVMLKLLNAACILPERTASCFLKTNLFYCIKSMW